MKRRRFIVKDVLFYDDPMEYLFALLDDQAAILEVILGYRHKHIRHFFAVQGNAAALDELSSLSL